MPEVNRREFLSLAAGLVAAGAVMPGGRAETMLRHRAAETCTLGRTGIQCSYLGIGTGIRGRGAGITDLTMQLTGDQYVALLEHAYARGITYFDLADRYGSHHFMRLALQRSIPREKVMLLSKVWSRDAGTVKSDLERMRQELDTDCIDVVLMHCIREGEENWPETLRPAMDVLEEAKVKGQIRAHGVSCHNFAAFERVPDEPWCDVVLARINPFGVHMDGPVEKVLPVLEKAHSAGMGVLGMKILGEGAPQVVEQMSHAVKFAMDLDCMDAMTIGFMNPEQLAEVMDLIDHGSDR